MFATLSGGTIRLICLAILFVSASFSFARAALALSTDHHPEYTIRTDLGEITIAIDDQAAPLTAANFAHYVAAGAFDGGSFYRTVRIDNQPASTVKISVIQGGARDGFIASPPIPLESTRTTGLSHRAGTISMARSSPDGATTDFFICVEDEPELDFGGRRNPDGQGFAAFGQVIKGMDVVKKIHEAPAQGQTLEEPVLIQSVQWMK